jgi:hypothetical protein
VTGEIEVRNLDKTHQKSTPRTHLCRFFMIFHSNSSFNTQRFVKDAVLGNVINRTDANPVHQKLLNRGTLQ